MNLTGTWKPFGRYVDENQKITIQDQELTFGVGFVGPTPNQTTVHFHLVEGGSLRENHCYNIEIEEAQFRNTDFIVHEETIEGKPVIILSNMCMEYDGRGRIVLASYVREEDYSLVNADFKSLAYKHYNDCPSIPMTQNNSGAEIAMGMMATMASMADMASVRFGIPTSTTVSTPSTQMEPWDCICGKKQNTSRFCPECGMPMPQK